MAGGKKPEKETFWNMKLFSQFPGRGEKLKLRLSSWGGSERFRMGEV